MDETANSTTAGTEHGRPYWMVGLALLGLVVAVLALAFFLDQRLRPHVGVAPVPTTTPAKSLPTPGGHTGQAAHPTAAPTAAGEAATPTPTAPPSSTLTPRQQVEQSYHRYWQDYSHALFTLDTSHMSDVATGDELKRVQSEVAALRQRKRAVRVRVSHSVLIVSVKGDRATLYDEQHDRSFLIDPATKEPHSGSVQPYLEKDIYFLRKRDGTWKVVKSLRQR